MFYAIHFRDVSQNNKKYEARSFIAYLISVCIVQHVNKRLTVDFKIRANFFRNFCNIKSE
jgi:hypothetical protein